MGVHPGVGSVEHGARSEIHGARSAIQGPEIGRSSSTTLFRRRPIGGRKMTGGGRRCTGFVRDLTAHAGVQSLLHRALAELPREQTQSDLFYATTVMTQHRWHGDTPWSALSGLPRPAMVASCGICLPVDGAGLTEHASSVRSRAHARFERSQFWPSRAWCRPRQRVAVVTIWRAPCGRNVGEADRKHEHK